MTKALGDDQIKSWRDTIPLKRGGSTEDVANVCLFLKLRYVFIYNRSGN